MDNRCKLFIGGLSLATTTPKLGQFFQRWGTVVDSNVMVNPTTQQSRGFGFITYANPSMVDVAMKNRPHVIDGRSVESKRPMPREMASSGSNVSCNKLLVRSSTVELNLPFNVQAVRTYFQNFGNVVNVTPPLGATGDFVVQFDDYDPVDKAILHGVHQLNGKTLVISKDTNSPVPQPGGGGINNGRLDCKVFVGGLDHVTTDISLSQYFGQFGEVISTHVMIDPSSGRSRGFGFVTFGDGASVDKALAQRPHQIDGRSVDVKRFESRESLSNKTSNSQAVVKNGNSAANMCRLFVGGLSQVTNDEKLRTYFGKYGEIVDGLVMKDQVTKRSRGFAFITFSAPEAVDAVMVDRPHSLDDKQVEVKRPMPKELAGPENTITVKKLFVGAVKDGTTDEQMREHFGTFGNIVDLCLPMDRNSGRLRGFAFIEYDDYDAADKAMVVGHHQVNGKVLDVKKALSKEEMARVSSATAAKQAKTNQDGGGFYGQQQQQGGYGAPQGGYGFQQGNTGYGAPQGYGGGYGAPQGQGGYGAPQGQGGYGAPQGQGVYGAPQGQGGYGAPQGQGGYGPPPVQGGYGAPQGQGGYGAPQAPGGYNAPQGQGGYGAPQGQGGYGAPQGPGGYNAPQGPGGYNAPPAQGGYNAQQGQGGYGAPPAQGGYTAPQGQGGFGAPPAQGGYTAPQGQGGYGAPPAQGGYVAPKVEGGSGDGFNGAGQGAGGGPIRAGQNYRQSPYNTNQRGGGGPPPTGKPPALAGPPPQQPAPNNQGYVRY